MKNYKCSRALDRVNAVMDGLIVAVLWFVCSLPVVTLGPASAAALSYFSGVDEITGNCFKRYFRAFGSCCKPGLIVWMVYLLLFVLLALDAFLCWNIINGAIGTIMKITTLVLFSATLSFYSISMGIIARFEVSFRHCFLDSLLFILHKPRMAVSITFLTGICLAGIVMLWPLVFFVAAPCFYFKARCFTIMFAEYIKSQENKERCNL